MELTCCLFGRWTHNIDTTKPHIDFVVWSFYLINLYFILQLPEKYGVCIDLNTFFNVFSMWNKHNERVHVQFWEFWDAGPDFWYMNNNNTMDLSTDNDDMMETLDNSQFLDQEQVCGPMRAKWAQYYHQTTSHISYILLSAKQCQMWTSTMS